MPAASSAVAVAACANTASGAGTGSVKAPPAVADVVPMLLPSTNTVTVLFASAVPVTVGCALKMVPLGALTTGAAGATVSLVAVALAVAMLLDISVCVATMATEPSANAVKFAAAV